VIQLAFTDPTSVALADASFTQLARCPSHVQHPTMSLSQICIYHSISRVLLTFALPCDIIASTHPHAMPKMPGARNVALESFICPHLWQHIN
jgi:hypothetical protein